MYDRKETRSEAVSAVVVRLFVAMVYVTAVARLLYVQGRRQAKICGVDRHGEREPITGVWRRTAPPHYPPPCKNSSDLYQFQERPLTKEEWTPLNRCVCRSVAWISVSADSWSTVGESRQSSVSSITASSTALTRHQSVHCGELCSVDTACACRQRAGVDARRWDVEVGTRDRQQTGSDDSRRRTPPAAAQLLRQQLPRTRGLYEALYTAH